MNLEHNLNYFSDKFRDCPYCNSKNIEIDIKSFTILGAHLSAIINCNSCNQKWFTDNRVPIKWNIPTKKEIIDWAKYFKAYDTYKRENK